MIIKNGFSICILNKNYELLFDTEKCNGTQCPFTIKFPRSDSGWRHIYTYAKAFPHYKLNLHLKNFR